MKLCALILMLPLMWLAGCGTPPQRAQFTSGYPTYNCPESLENQVSLQTEVRPIQLEAGSLKETSIATIGSIGRRLLVSVTPSGLRPKDRIVWSTLSIGTFGGTLLGWTNYELGQRNDGAEETSSVVASPGQLKITRVAKGRADLAGAQSIDLLIMPGGVVVDDTIVSFSGLWTESGRPSPIDSVSLQLVPIRHPPGLDVVKATLELNYVVQLGDTEDEWVCASQARVTLVDHDSLRQPLWDLGLASANAVRKERIALFDPALGAVRLVFDNPASAHSFVSWMRATGATRVGTYSLSLFDQAGPWSVRPFGPVGEDLMPTLRSVTTADIAKIKVGPAGDP